MLPTPPSGLWGPQLGAVWEALLGLNITTVTTLPNLLLKKSSYGSMCSGNKLTSNLAALLVRSTRLFFLYSRSTVCGRRTPHPSFSQNHQNLCHITAEKPLVVTPRTKA